MSKPAPLPSVCSRYQYLYNTFKKRGWKEKLFLHYPAVKDKNYLSLLDWLSNKLHYPQTELEEYYWSIKMNEEGRPEDPIRILQSSIKVENRTLGRCGEFCLVYLSLLLANDYEANIMVGWWSKGDHVWIEVLDNDEWIFVDPTDSCNWRETYPNKSWMECSKISNTSKLWGDRIWNRVYRINEDDIVDTTKQYNGEWD